MNVQNQKASEMILNALNEVEDEMIEEAAPVKMNTFRDKKNAEDYSRPTVAMDKKTKKSPIVYLNRNWKKLTAIAACLVIFVVGGSSAWQSMAKSSLEGTSYENGFIGSYNGGVTDSLWSKGDRTEVFEEEEFSGNGLVPGEFSPESIKGNQDSAQMPAMDQKLIYTANLKLETLEFEAVVREIKSKITELGGFIESDEIYDSSNGIWYSDEYEKKKGTMTENITVRIPADRYDEFLKAATEANGKVTSLVQNVENITREYNDLSTTIQSLKTQESRLLEMLKEAETVEDMIYVESRLSEVQNELRIYQNHLNEMDTDVAYSTVYLKIAEVVKYTNTPAPKSTFLERLQSTLMNSGEGFLNFLENTLFFVITILPEVILAGAIVVVVILVVKSNKKKSKSLTAEKSDEDHAENA